MQEFKRAVDDCDWILFNFIIYYWFNILEVEYSTYYIIYIPRYKNNSEYVIKT